MSVVAPIARLRRLAAMSSAAAVMALPGGVATAADPSVADRLTGLVMETSTNRLTGERIVIRTDAQGRRTVRRATVPVATTLIEAVDHTRPG